MYLTTQLQNTKCHHPRTNSLRLAQGEAGTYDRRCGQSSRTTPCLPGHRFGNTQGEPGMRTLAQWCMYTKSSHREPRRARDPPEGGSGRTLRQSSVAGTAPTWPVGKETLQHGPRRVLASAMCSLTVLLRMALRETWLSSQDPAGTSYSTKSLRPCSFGVQRWRQQFFCPALATSLP